MVSEALELVAAALKGAGIPATADPTVVHPPGAWLAARRLGTAYFDGQFGVVVNVYLIAKDNGTPYALAALDDMLATTIQVARENSFEITNTYLDQSVALPSGGGPLPSFMVEIEINP